MKQYQYENRQENIPAAIQFIRESLQAYRVKIRKPEQDFYYLSELLSFLAEQYPDTKSILLQVTKRFDTVIQIFFDGEKMDMEGLFQKRFSRPDAAIADEVEAGRIRELFQEYFKPKNFSQKYNGTLNTLTLIIRHSNIKSMVVMLISMVLGTGVGLAMRAFLPEAATSFIAGNILQTVTTIFMNCIKMLIGPLIFFTVASSISSYTDLSSLGRMGSKLCLRYFINAVLALAVATGLTLLIKPGMDDNIPTIDSLIKSASSAVDTAAKTEVSLKSTILGIFPSNFFKAFTDASILQIIFISFLLGICTALLHGEVRSRISGFLSAGNTLFCKMMSIVMLALPVSVFCSMANAILTLGVDMLVLLVRWLVTLVASFALMIVVYVLLIALFTHISPATYLKRYGTAILGAFAMGSSNSSMPLCISTCEERLGVSPKVASFSIPVGVSLHCASNCIFYLVSVYFLANVYSPVDITPLTNLMMFFSIFVLGIGAPSVPGAGPVCVAVLLAEMGMPMGLITLIIGLDPFVSMFKTATSCVEDSYVTLAVAKSEKLLDRDVLKRE